MVLKLVIQIKCKLRTLKLWYFLVFKIMLKFKLLNLEPIEPTTRKRATEQYLSSTADPHFLPNLSVIWTNRHNVQLVAQLKSFVWLSQKKYIICLYARSVLQAKNKETLLSGIVLVTRQIETCNS
jgi:hypothetical protein